MGWELLALTTFSGPCLVSDFGVARLETRPTSFFVSEVLSKEALGAC